MRSSVSSQNFTQTTMKSVPDLRLTAVFERAGTTLLYVHISVVVVYDTTINMCNSYRVLEGHNNQNKMWLVNTSKKK